MNKLSPLIFIITLFIQSSFSLAADINIKGQIRSIYDYGNTRNGLAIGGYIGFEIGFLDNVTTKFSAYTAQPIIGSNIGIVGTGLVEGKKGFSLLGEALFNYKDDVHNITVGRQLVSSPLVTSQQHIIIPGLFSGINYSNNFFDATEVRFMYLNEMSGRDNLHEKSEWLSMSEVLGTSYKKGMFALGLTNTSSKKSEIQLWHYHIPQTLDVIFASNIINLGNSGYKLESHYWRSVSKGSFKLDTNNEIDYYLIGSQISKDLGKWTLKIGYDYMSKKRGSYTIPKAFGNYAVYTYGLRIDPGAYGANIRGSGLNIKSMNAIKFTSIYTMKQRSVDCDSGDHF